MQISEKKVICTENAPKALGPYSVGTSYGNLIFTAGQIGIDPKSGLIPDGIEAQTHQVLRNIGAILTEAGCSMEKVLKTTVFLKSMDDFGAMNTVYGEYFGGDFPARSTVEVCRLPKDVLVEIEVIAGL